MKEINIKVENISSKQWPLLLIELNLVARTWKKYGPIIDIKAKNFNKIIKWGRKKHGEDIGDIDSTFQRKSRKRTTNI
jgi:hypothetical protein